MHSLIFFFALLYCLHLNYALLSELIGSLAKAIRNGGVRPDSDVLLDVYIVIHPADLSASLLNTSAIIIWMDALRLALLSLFEQSPSAAIHGGFFLPFILMTEITLHSLLQHYIHQTKWRLLPVCKDIILKTLNIICTARFWLVVESH